MARKKPEKNKEIRGRTLGEEVQAGLNAGVSAPFTLAPSSAPVTLAPSQGSISRILSARGLFERNFQKKRAK